MFVIDCANLGFIFIFSFLQRYILTKKANIGFDMWGHLYFIKELKMQKTGPWGKLLTQDVESKGFMHPFFWHFCMSFLAIDFLIKRGKYLNVLLDSFFAMIIYISCKYLGYDMIFSLICSFLYLLTPMWFSDLSIGPRVTNFTPRLFSEIFVNFFFMVTLLPLPISFLIKLFGGAIFAFVALASSKFGLQVLLFLAPAAYFFTNDALPVISCVLGFLLIIILSKGKFLFVIKAQLAHLVWYFKNNLSGKTAIAGRNSLAFLFVWNPSLGVARNFLRICYRAVGYNSFTGVLLKMPILPALYFILLFDFKKIDAHLFLLGPVFGASLVFLTVNIPVFLFLGEAERYLNHVAFFIIVAFLEFSYKYHLLIIALLVYGLVYYMAEVLLFPKIQKSMVTQDDEEYSDKEIIDWLNSCQEDLRILCYPYHAVGVYKMMLFTAHQVLFPALSHLRDADWIKIFAKFDNGYPYVKLDMLDEIADQYGVNFLILDRKSLLKNGYGQWRPSGKWSLLQLGNGKYFIYIKKAIL
ncbi:MAG: hypothetical protein LBQ58_06810 [Synergistaceae bacterium]|jgi:hypothetical protein|nr:hypothetical protein [Synergistaceae bacterium]